MESPFIVPDDESTIVVVGAGLAGAMMALMLARRGHAVQVFERNEDYRRQELVTDEEESCVLERETRQRP